MLAVFIHGLIGVMLPLLLFYMVHCWGTDGCIVCLRRMTHMCEVQLLLA